MDGDWDVSKAQLGCCYVVVCGALLGLILVAGCAVSRWLRGLP